MINNLPDFIKQLRKENNLTQEYVASEIGVSRPTYEQIEKGKRELTISEAEKLANSSFFPPDYIPKRFCSKRDKNGKKYPTVDDVVNYVKEFSGDIFEENEEYKESRKCVSFYKICE